MVDSKKMMLKHQLIPVHTKISDDEKEKLLSHYNIDIKCLPKIFKNDPAIKHLDLELNDVVKIERESITAGKSFFYRRVING